jgi:Domain of unknown function (DUF4178)
MRTLVFLLGLVAAGLIGAWLATKGTRKPQQPSRRVDPFATAPAHDSVQSLDVGWIAQYQNSDYVVRERVNYMENGFGWMEVLLDDSKQSFWLEIEQDDELLLTRWDNCEVDDPAAVATNTISVGGVRYELEETGQPRFTASGTTGLPLSGSVRYRTFSSNDERSVSCDEWIPGTWEAAISTSLRPFEIRVVGPSDLAKK